MAYIIQRLDITEVSLNDNNPRFIKDKSFKDLVKSLKECPALFDARPLLCNADRVILGGNMRYRAALELRYTEVPVIIMEGLTPEQEREIVIKDNGGFGSWDFEALANDWSDLPLDEWGVDMPGFDMDSEDLGEDFSLADGDKSPFQSMAFTLADEQAEVIKNAIADIKKTEDFKYAETMGNENGNGNALYLIVAQWVAQRI